MKLLDIAVGLLLVLGCIAIVWMGLYVLGLFGVTTPPGW